MLKGRFFWIIASILVVALLIVLNYNESNVKILPSYQTSSMEKLYLKHKDGSRVQWELTSERATLPTGNREVLLETLALKINQTPEIYVTSGNGVYEVESGDMTLRNSVELKMKDSTFMTDSLNWNSADEIIDTDDDVKLVGGNFFITGSGLVSHVKQEQVRIVKDVKAIFYR